MQLLRAFVPERKVRVVNVVNLMTLLPPEEHPHGLSDNDFDVLFTEDKPIIFAFHGYPWLIHKEEGTTTTPFDMVVLDDLDRYHLVGDVWRAPSAPLHYQFKPDPGDCRKPRVLAHGRRS